MLKEIMKIRKRNTENELTEIAEELGDNIILKRDKEKEVIELPKT